MAQYISISFEALTTIYDSLNHQSLEGKKIILEPWKHEISHIKKIHSLVIVFYGGVDSFCGKFQNELFFCF